MNKRSSQNVSINGATLAGWILFMAGLIAAGLQCIVPSTILLGVTSFSLILGGIGVTFCGPLVERTGESEGS